MQTKLPSDRVPFVWSFAWHCKPVPG